MTEILSQRCPLHILIAEDNKLNWRILQRILQKLGYESKVVENGLDAVLAAETALTEAQPYDLIFMDIQMPIMDGITATQEIFQRVPIEQQPQVVIVTANATAEYRKICQRLGTHSIIEKPISKQGIMDALESCYHDLRQA